MKRSAKSGLVVFVAVSCSTPRDPPASMGDTPRTAAVEVAGAVPNQSPVAVLIARAESVYLQAEFDTARVALERALVIARAAADSLNEARALTLLGLTAWRTADLVQARTLGERALEVKRRLRQPAELSRSYNALGLLAWNEGRLADAVELFHQTTEAATAERDSATLAKAASNLGLVYVEQGNLTAAQAGFEAARDIAAKRADARIEGGALTNLGMLYVQLGDPGSAVVALTRALERYRSIAYATGEQNTLGQLATAYEALGEPRLAFAAADSALTLARQHGLRQEEAANIELAASLHRHAGDARRALALYERGRALYQEMGAAVDEGRSLRDAAEVEASLGRRDIARAFTTTALELHGRSGAKLEALRDHLLLADLASQSGAREEAIRHLAAARASASTLGVRPARVDVALARATIADREGNGRAVLQSLAAVRSDFERGGYGTEWREASLRARAFATIGELDSAVVAGRRAVAAIERLRARFGSRYFRSTFAADKAETYAGLVEVLLRLRQEGEAFEVTDAARSRALIENLGVVESDSAGRGAVRILRDGNALLSRIDVLAARLDTLEETPLAERDDATKANAAALVASLAEARSAYEALLVAGAERSGDGAALLGAHGARVAEIRSALAPGEALVEYLTTPSRVITFVVTATDVRHVSVEVPHDQIVRQARIARDLVGHRASSDPAVNEMLTALHDVLIAPAERAGLLRNMRRLIVVPHSFMSYLPFSALRRGTDGRYVVQDYAVLSAHSAGAFAELRRARRAELAGSVFARSNGFAPFPDGLPATKRELRAFERVVRSAAGESGARATEARVRAALASGGIVHVASHGQMNPHNPMFSRIELARGGGKSVADDGRLEVHEVLGLRVNARLVFLSGCETGIGPAWSTEFVRGDDYASLAQAFLFAGARSVVSTLWPIADDGAAEFATRFYAHLGTEALPEALAAAQREMLSVGAWSAPYYWAAYQVSGDGAAVGVKGFRTKQAGSP